MYCMQFTVQMAYCITHYFSDLKTGKFLDKRQTTNMLLSFIYILCTVPLCILNYCVLKKQQQTSCVSKIISVKKLDPQNISINIYNIYDI